MICFPDLDRALNTLHHSKEKRQADDEPNSIPEIKPLNRLPTIRPPPTENQRQCSRVNLFAMLTYWRTVFGSASSKACFNMTSLSCQNSKLPICRSFIDSSRQLTAFPSMNSSFRFLLCSLRNHAIVFLSLDGSKRDSVRNVSSTNPAGNKSLSRMLEKATSCYFRIDQRPTTLAAVPRKMHAKTNGLWCRHLQAGGDRRGCLSI